MMTSIDRFQLRHVRLKLKIWGSWCEQILSWGLSYSDRSLLYRLMKEGGMMVRGATRSHVPDNAEAEEVNTLVEELGSHDLPLAKVLVSHYVSRDALERRLLRLGVGRNAYYNYLKQAEHWLLQKLF